MKTRFINDSEQAIDILTTIKACVDSGEVQCFEYDIETGNYNENQTGLNAVTNVISLAQIGIDQHVFVFDILQMKREVSLLLFDLLEDDRVTKIIHNAVFEYMSHLNYGVKIKNFVCTMIAEKLIQAGHKQAGFGLADIVLTRLGVLLDKTEQLSNWLERPLRPEQIQYASKDVLYLTKIWEKQKEAMDENDWRVFQLEMDCLAVFAEMQYNGITFDLTMAEETKCKIEKKLNQKLVKLQKELPEIPLPKSAWNTRKDGTKTLAKPFKVWPSGFKPVQGIADIKTAMMQLIGEENMPKKDVKDTKTGQWRKSICFDEKHRPLIEHELMPDINSYAKLSGLWTKYIQNITEWPNKITGKVHYRIDQLLKTGRISVSDPPVQQFPGKGKGAVVRNCFVAQIYDIPSDKVLKGLEKLYQDNKKG